MATRKKTEKIDTSDPEQWNAFLSGIGIKETKDDSAHREDRGNTLPGIPDGEDSMGIPNNPSPGVAQESDTPRPTRVKNGSVSERIGNSNHESASSPPTEAPTETSGIAVEQSRKTRKSAKMVEEEFDALAAQYLQVTGLAEKCPVFLPKHLRDRLGQLAAMTGNPKLSPSHIVINLVRVFFDTHKETLNRKAASIRFNF